MIRKNNPLLFAIVFVLTAVTLNTCAQSITLVRDDYDRSIYLKADTISVKQGFEILQVICKGKIWNRHVIKNDTTYLRFGVSVFKKVYRIEGKNLVRVKEFEL